MRAPDGRLLVTDFHVGPLRPPKGMAVAGLLGRRRGARPAPPPVVGLPPLGRRAGDGGAVRAGRRAGEGGLRRHHWPPPAASARRLMRVRRSVTTGRSLERGVPTAIGAGRASGSAVASRRVLDLASRRMTGSDRARLTLRHAPGAASAVRTEGNVAMRLTENRYEFWRRVVLVVASLALSLTAGMVTLAAPADAAVRACTGATPVSSRPTLHSGDTGSCVKLAQNRLISNGYSVGSAGADGVFSPATRLAILRFQESRGLVADAIIGPRTWAALEGSPPPSPYDKHYGPNYTNRVLLSFDDCPQTLTKLDNALNWLDANNVGVMFFPTGNCISSFGSRYGVDITVLMRTHRQYVGNHSISHPDLTKLSYAGVLYQLGAPGVVTNYGRPPYGAVNSTVNSAYAAKLVV